MVVILYMLEVSSPCRAVLMAAQHLDVKLQVVNVRTMQRSDFLKINPRGCVPTIDDEGFRLWESRAIMAYLVNKYAPQNSLYPVEPEKRALVDMMLCFDQGTLYKSQVRYLYPRVFYGEKPDKTRETDFRNSLFGLEQALTVNPYVAGDHLTLADLSIAANLALAEVFDYDFNRYLNIRSWLNMLKESLPYYRELNEIPVMQFKLCGNQNLAYIDDEENVTNTKL